MRAKCTCPDSHARLYEMCPLHKAAPVMLRALKRLVRRFDKGETFGAEWFGVDAAREAIKAAEPVA